MGLLRKILFILLIAVFVSPLAWAQQYAETYYSKLDDFGCGYLIGQQRTEENVHWALCHPAFERGEGALFPPPPTLVAWDPSGSVAILNPPNGEIIKKIARGVTGLWVYTRESLYWIDSPNSQYVKYYDHPFDVAAPQALRTGDIAISPDGTISAFYARDNNHYPETFALTGGQNYLLLDFMGNFTYMHPSIDRKDRPAYEGRLSDGRLVYEVYTHKKQVFRPKVCKIDGACVDCPIKVYHGTVAAVEPQTDRIFGSRYETSRYVAGYWKADDKRCNFTKLKPPREQSTSTSNVRITGIDGGGAILGWVSNRGKAEDLILWPSANTGSFSLSKYLKKLRINKRKDLWGASINKAGEILIYTESVVKKRDPSSGEIFSDGSGHIRYLLLKPIR